MELQKVTLCNVNTETLRKYLAISMSVKKSEILNFSIENSVLSGINNNEADSIYKMWQLPLAKLTGLADNDPTYNTIPKLKCSLYKGDSFSKQVLGHFGQLVDMEIEHVLGTVKKINLSKKDANGRTILAITVLCARAETTFIEYEPELISQIFKPKPETKLVSFKLETAELSAVTKLSKLSTNPDTQSDYISLYTKDGSIFATDKAFDVFLHETDIVLNEPVEIDKSLWRMIDNDDYTATVYQAQDDNKILVCESKTKSVSITLVLLSSVDTDIDFDDFDDMSDTWE